MRRDYIADIALQRIRRLMELAEKVFDKDPELAHRYAELAFRIALRARIRMPKEYKLRICKKCMSYLQPGVTARVRVRSGRMPHVVITCLRCGYMRRIPTKRRSSKAARSPEELAHRPSSRGEDSYRPLKPRKA